MKDFIAQLPKAELHVHLEGAVTPEFWLKLIKKHQPDNTLTLDQLKKRFVYNSFPDFLETFRDVVFSFYNADDLYDLTATFLNQSADQNVRYCEVMFTPYFLIKRGLDYHDMMAEIVRAAKETERKRGIEMKLIFDGPRNFGNKVVRELFELAANDRTGHVVGVGLGGDEKSFPARDFQNEFQFAEAHGLKTIAHAGEPAGTRSIIDTITLLNVSRIGHGLGIIENSDVESLIFDRNITLDLCPGSNVKTRSINSLNEHPLKNYLERGYSVTLNSDDPGLFSSTLNNEYLAMAKICSLSPDQITQIAINSINGSFLPQSRKRQLIDEIDAFAKSP